MLGGGYGERFQMTDNPKDTITVVIPAFNEEKTIAQIVEGARAYADDVLVVDDGSWDLTALRAISAGAKVIRIPKNGGKGVALAIGLTTAALNGSNVVVCLDADGQHDPHDIPRIVKPIVDGNADMVIGSRFLDSQGKSLIPSYRRIGQSVLTVVTNLGNTIKITDSQSGYRAFKKDVLEDFDYSVEGMGIESNMVRSAAKRGLAIQEIPIVVKYDGLDTSTFRPGSHGMNVLGSVLKSIRTEHPLLYFGVGGMVMTVVGVTLGLYSIQQYIEIRALPFGPSLIAVMITTLGILFVLVGLILNAISDLMEDGKRPGSH